MTLSEVKALLEDGITVGGKTVRELRETLNHADVIDTLYDFFHIKNKDIQEKSLLSLHALLMR